MLRKSISALRRRQAPGQQPPADWLRSKPWTSVTVPEEVERYPSMLWPDEKALLYALGSHATGAGIIVDAGCFLGGSTIALARGLEANPHRDRFDPRPIHSYDLFLLDEWTKAQYSDLLEDIEPGASFRPKFDELLRRHAADIAVHEGDVCEFSWPGDPIEVLFVDICKSWAINDHVVQQFFPALIPDQSVVVQQDFIHEWLPQIHVAMGLLDDAFELVGVADPCSALYVPTRPIHATEIPARLSDLPDDDKLACLDRACAPFQGEHRAVLNCPRAVLLAQLGRHDDALQVLDAVPVADNHRVASSVHETRSWILREHPDPAVSAAAWATWHAEHPT